MSKYRKWTGYSKKVGKSISNINKHMAEDQIQQSVLNKARADKFLIVFDIPPVLKTLARKLSDPKSRNAVIPDSVQFSIFGSLVPEITVPAVENRYSGSTLYVSSHSKNSYPPVNVKFNVDNEYKNWWTIYQWLNLMHDEKTGRYNERDIDIDFDIREYQTDITIYGLDEFDKRVIAFKYVKAFPTSINTIDYDYQSSGEIVSGFVFVYSQMHTELLFDF
jgi:hypothetical protein